MINKEDRVSKFEDVYNSLSDKLRKIGNPSIPFDEIDGPLHVELCKDIYSNPKLTNIVHETDKIKIVRRTYFKNSVVKEHNHPDCTEHIYVISGRAINWSKIYEGNGESKLGQVLVPQENIDSYYKLENPDRFSDLTKAYTVKPGEPHSLTILEDYTIIVSKYVKHD